MTDSIRFEHVTKEYRLGAGRDGLRDTLANGVRRLTQRAQSSDRSGILLALNDVSFNLPAGRALGVIGSNGAGKTTMLKLLSRITRPTRGEIMLKGRVAALIELGAGFHPDLTGRENVFLNGAILGLNRSEIKARYDSIVAFAELEDFMDTPVKRYSSGMYARLGFSVAAHLEPDILLVDEVLSVGDRNFQLKCFDFIRSFVNSGRTTVFVSHNLYAIEQLSESLLWLDHGRIMQLGNTHDVLTAYMQAQDERLLDVDAPDSNVSSILKIDRAYISDVNGNERQVLESGDEFIVHIAYDTSHPVEKPHFVVAVWDNATNQPLFIASMLADNQAPEVISGKGEISCHFKPPQLMPRAYQVWGEVFDADRQGVLMRWQPLAAFSVHDKNFVSSPGSLRHTRVDAPVRAPYQWSL
jgi:lipopolysaccharide transport system ATP-binding protein